MNFYDFKFTDTKKQEHTLEEFRGKTLLIVNTASKCSFTPQYESLEDLYKKYQDKGLVILGFPCNQFGNQEPGNEEDINSFCQLNYGVTFPLSQKVDVNGENTHPIFEYLKAQLPGLMGSKAIKWNFTKFLIDANGEPFKRYAPTIDPRNIEDDIKDLLPL